MLVLLCDQESLSVQVIHEGVTLFCDHFDGAVSDEGRFCLAVIVGPRVEGRPTLRHRLEVRAVATRAVGFTFDDGSLAEKFILSHGAVHGKKVADDVGLGDLVFCHGLYYPFCCEFCTVWGNFFQAASALTKALWASIIRSIVWRVDLWTASCAMLRSMSRSEE